MLKKELREIITPALLRVSTIGLIFLIFLVNFNFYLGSSQVRAGILLSAYIIFWIANNLGINAFKYEYRDQAFEYMLSFPISKYRVIWYKLVPRIAVLFLLIVIYSVVAYLFLIPGFKYEFYRFGYFAVFAPMFFPVWVIYFLLGSFSMGLFDWKNLRILIGFSHLSLTILISIGIKTLFNAISIGFNSFYLYGISFVIGCVIVTTIMGAAFILVFKKFDVKSMKIHRKKFLILALPPLLLLTTASIVFVLIRSNY